MVNTISLCVQLATSIKLTPRGRSDAHQNVAMIRSGLVNIFSATTGPVNVLAAANGSVNRFEAVFTHPQNFAFCRGNRPGIYRAKQF